ncbi:MAG TPA: hypothetical protein VK543_15265, partial [Puia sp.]|nr:hypothetical protein [Puia sp.]
SCDVDSPSAVGEQAFAEVEMSYDNVPVGARSLELPFSLGRGDLAVVVSSLQYRVAKSGRTAL